MEIKLNGKEAVVVFGVAAMNAVIACVSLKAARNEKRRADREAFMAKAYKIDSKINRVMVDELMKENTKLKSSLKNRRES